MCGIVGFWSKTTERRAALGNTLLRMLSALARRGPDSAGVAFFGDLAEGDMVLRIKLGEEKSARESGLGEKGKEVAARVQSAATLHQAALSAGYLRLLLAYQGDPRHLERLIEAVDPNVEVVSMGRHLEIVKEVGSPRALDAAHGVARFAGTHGLGHTRLSTESRIDLSHSQPFWAHGHPDLAVVHNGHITNYHKLRRRYEEQGLRFYTENDSEIIGVYLGEHLAQGMDLEEAMRASLADLDGSFSYLAASSRALGFARDPFALKPLLLVEADAFVAASTEEIALRAALEGTYGVRETRAGEVRVWRR